jgi:hypothetical protein
MKTKADYRNQEAYERGYQDGRFAAYCCPPDLLSKARAAYDRGYASGVKSPVRC